MTIRFVMTAAFLTCAYGALAQSERVIYSFAGAPDGAGPLGGLSADTQGNFYGTTEGGGAGCGTVFEVTRATGAVSESVLWAFGSSGASDGCNPYGGVIADASGNLYGTTFNGGAAGYGTVFEISPDGSGGWNEKVIWSFQGVNGSIEDGTYPAAGLTMDASGNLYGTTAYGGGLSSGSACGIVFELSPNAGGVWSESVLHVFGACGDDSSDYARPFSGVTLDEAGNLYGTTDLGGLPACDFGCGTVFMLEKASAWQETVLYQFQGGNDGATPYTPVTFASPGHLLGTTFSGGVYGSGVAYELIHSAGGWQETVLHAFGSPFGNPPDGENPSSGLARGGNHYYGTTWDNTSSGGTVYELSHAAAGWSYRILHSFELGSGGFFNEYYGEAVLVAPEGRVYGATDAGGAGGFGTVFEITPSVQ